MSKFSNMLRMIILLKNNRILNTKKLSELLEVNERMIRKYRQDLELAGVYIESHPGANGGYSLEGYDYLLHLDLSEEEIEAIQLAEAFLEEQNYLYSKAYKTFTEKIQALKMLNCETDSRDFAIKELKPINMGENKAKGIKIHQAIISKCKIKIKYFSLTSGEKTRIVHPYSFITYKSDLYFIGYCEMSNEIRCFKVSRIIELNVLEENFTMLEDFDIKKYMDNTFGIYMGEEINIKLLIKKPMSYIVSEKMWTENQKITWQEDNSIIFEAKMRGKTEIKSWILSMGARVEVLEPNSLIGEIKDEIKAVSYIYNH